MTGSPREPDDPARRAAPGTGTEAGDAERPVVRVVQMMARSGGTAISKCLAVMDGVMLLSEVHPKGIWSSDPVKQAREWFDLFTAEEAAAYAPGKAPFTDVILEIQRRAEARGRHLVLREWSYLDYVAVPFLGSPTYRPTMVEMLAERFRVVRTATVRHPIDQWLSMRRLTVIQKSGLTLPDFLAGYRHFAEYAATVGFVRYEDFTRDPDTALATLCERLELPFDPGYAARWMDYGTITGHMKSRYPTEIIKAPPRPPLAPEVLHAFQANPDYRAAIRLLGYGHPL